MLKIKLSNTLPHKGRVHTNTNTIWCGNRVKPIIPQCQANVQHLECSNCRAVFCAKHAVGVVSKLSGTSSYPSLLLLLLRNEASYVGVVGCHKDGGRHNLQQSNTLVYLSLKSTTSRDTIPYKRTMQDGIHIRHT